MFLDQTSGLVAAAVRRVIGSGKVGLELEDVVQGVYVKLVRNDFRLLRSFDARRASLSTWITIVARSTAIDELRRRHLATSPLTEDLPARHAPGPATVETVEIPRHVLTERQRLVLSLLFDDDRSVAEAARFLNVSEQTVRSTKHKALERLRRSFETAADGDVAGADAVPKTVEHGTTHHE